MNLLAAKIIAMVIMGVLSLFFGLLPLKVKSMVLKGEENSRKRRQRERIISGLLCFGSGVLIATVFIHMIPETREGFKKARKLGLLESMQTKSNQSGVTLELIDNHDGHSHHGAEVSDRSSYDHDHGNLHNHPEHENHEHHGHNHDHESHHTSTDLLSSSDSRNTRDRNPVSDNPESTLGMVAEDTISGKEKDSWTKPEENEIQTNGSDRLGSGPRFDSLQDPHDEHHDHDHDEEDHGYPLAELVICAGFFLIYLIEETLHKILFRHADDDDEENLVSSDGAKDPEDVDAHHPSHHLHIAPFHTRSRKNSQTSLGDKAKSVNGDVKKTMSPQCQWGPEGVDNPVFAGDVDATTWNPRVRNSLVLQKYVSSTSLNESPEKQKVTSSKSYSPNPASDDNDKASTSSTESSNGVLAKITSLLIIVALSFHAVFEGMAIGLQEVQIGVLYLFLAISAHKFVIVFCIGLELLTVGTHLTLMILYMLVLALVSPLGIAIGIIVTENPSLGGHAHTLVVTILQGIAGGTILYVAFLEVLERERHKRGGRLLKLFCLMLGFAVMASLEASGGHSH